MNKKDFLQLIKDNIAIFHCISLYDASVSDAHTEYTGVRIIWKNQFNGTSLKTMKCSQDDEKAMKMKAKYVKWSEPIIAEYKSSKK